MTSSQLKQTCVSMSLIPQLLRQTEVCFCFLLKETPHLKLLVPQAPRIQNSVCVNVFTSKRKSVTPINNCKLNNKIFRFNGSQF